MIDRVVFAIYGMNYQVSKESLVNQIFSAIDSSVGRSRSKRSSYKAVWSYKRDAGWKVELTARWKNRSTLDISATLEMNGHRLVMRELLQGNVAISHRSLDDNDNFISDYFRASHNMKQLHDCCIERMSSEIDLFLSDINGVVGDNFPHKSEEQKRGSVAIQEIELCWDIPTQNAQAMVPNLLPPFRMYFKNIQYHDFPGKSVTEGLNKNAMSISATNGKRDRYKLYAKTSKLVRLERNINKNVIRKIAKSNVIGESSQHALARIVEVLSKDTIRVWHLTGIDVKHESIGKADITVIFEIARSCHRNPDVFDLVMRSLCLNLRVTTRPKLYDILPSLCRKNILIRKSRGLYVPRENDIQLFKSLGKLYVAGIMS